MSFDDLMEQGRRALEEDDSQKALSLLEEAISLQQTAEAYLLLAEAQLEENRLAKAKKCVAAGLQLEAENIELLYLSADISLEEENTELALQRYQQIIEIDSGQIDARVNKALLELDVDQLEVAEQSCREALAIEPDSVLALNALGDICVAGNNATEALSCYRKAAELDPEEPQTFLNLADLYYDSGQLELAEEASRKALELDAGLAPGYLTLGYITMDQDRSREAVENFQQFLKLEKSPAAKQIRDEVNAVIEGLK